MEPYAFLNRNIIVCISKYPLIDFNFNINHIFLHFLQQGFRTAAEQQITEKQKQFQDSKTSVEPDLESLRKLALIIYDQYLSDKVNVLSFSFLVNFKKIEFCGDYAF